MATMDPQPPFAHRGPMAGIGGRTRSWSLGSAPSRSSFLAPPLVPVVEEAATLPAVGAGTIKSDDVLLTKVIQERKAQEESLTMKRLESFKMSKFIDDEEDLLTLEKTYRMPSTYSPEQIKYIKSQVLSKLNGEENRLNEKIKLVIKADKRFSREVNEFIERELYKRVHDLKYGIYVKMEKHQTRLNELGIFDEAANHVRIRSLFKVELQKLVDSVEQIFKEVVAEVEAKHGLTSSSPSEPTRRSRKSGLYLEQLRKYRSEQMEPRKHSKSVGSGSFDPSSIESSSLAASLNTTYPPPRIDISPLTPHSQSRPSSASVRLAPLSPHVTGVHSSALSVPNTAHHSHSSAPSTPLPTPQSPHSMLLSPHYTPSPFSSSLTYAGYAAPAVSPRPESPPRLQREEKKEDEAENEDTVGEEEKAVTTV